MRQKSLQWDALDKMGVQQHVLHHANVIAQEDAMHCVEIHVTMTAQVVVRLLAMVAAREVVDNTFLITITYLVAV